MQITDIHSEKRGFCLYSVRFAPDEGAGKKGVRQTRTMNRFYEALEQAAEAYAADCREACALSRYICEIRAVQEKDTTVVTVCLCHRLPGENTRRKHCVHQWRNGLLHSEKQL